MDVSDAELREVLIKTAAGLTDEQRQNDAVFTCFGAAAKNAQQFEAALGDFLVVYNKIATKTLSLEDFEVIELSLQKKTLGALLKELRKYVKIQDQTVEEHLDNALAARNFLMHHFFRERESQLGTEQGRFALLKELSGIGIVLESATTTANGMRIALSEAFNPTRDRPDASEVLFTMKVNMPDGIQPPAERGPPGPLPSREELGL